MRRLRGKKAIEPIPDPGLTQAETVAVRLTRKEIEALIDPKDGYLYWKLWTALSALKHRDAA